MIDWFKDKKLSIDPRTKVVLLLLCVFSAMLAPSLQYELVLIMIIALIRITKISVLLPNVIIELQDFSSFSFLITPFLLF